MSLFPIANLMRQKRLFNPYNEEEDNERPKNTFREFDLSTPNADALSTHLDNVPNREDYQFGTKDKILNAIIGGLTGFTSGGREALGVTQINKERPYRQALESWGIKGRGLEEAADIESRRINSKIRQQQLETQYLMDVNELDQKREKQTQDEEDKRARRNEVVRQHDLEDADRDSLRTQTGAYQGRMAGAAETRAQAAITNANRPRTGNQPKPTPMYEDSSDAYSAALGAILEEEPGFSQYLNLETGKLTRNEDGQLAKLVGRKLVPLTNDDKFELKRIGAKLKLKQEEFLRKTREFDSTPGTITEEDDNDE